MDDELARMSAQEKLLGLLESCFEDNPNPEGEQAAPRSLLRGALEAGASRIVPQEPLAQATPLHIVLATAIKVAQLDTTDVDLETLINTHSTTTEQLLPIPRSLKNNDHLRQYNPRVNLEGETGHDCVLCEKHFTRIEGIREHWTAHRKLQPLHCSHWGCHDVSQNYGELQYHEASCTAQADALANGLPTKKAKSTRSTRSRHPIGEDTHCNCMWTSEAKAGQPCCVTDDCPCVQKGMACIGCACMRCKNKRPASATLSK